MFSLFTGRHVGGLKRSSNMAAPYYWVILCGKFRRISQLWDDAHTLNLENCFLYLLSTTSQFFDFVRCIVFDFIFYCVTAHSLYMGSVCTLGSSLWLHASWFSGSNNFMIWQRILMKPCRFTKLGMINCTWRCWFLFIEKYKNLLILRDIGKNEALALCIWGREDGREWSATNLVSSIATKEMLWWSEIVLGEVQNKSSKTCEPAEHNIIIYPQINGPAYSGY